jgi:hypothetical protein
MMAFIIAQRASLAHSWLSRVHALKIAGSNPACEVRSCEPKAAEEQSTNTQEITTYYINDSLYLGRGSSCDV